MRCLICNEFEDENRVKFSKHLQFKHRVKSEAYTIKYLFGGRRPECPVCGTNTRYVSFGFKRYCKRHAKLAESEGGRKGGQREAWNKGKTKRTDKRIERQSLKMSGKGNPFYGKSHSRETRDQISRSKTLTAEIFERRKRERANEIEILTSYEEYFSRQRQYLECKCRSCGDISKKTLQAFERGSPCFKCNPISTSAGEREIRDFINDLGLRTVENDRKLLNGREIDILVPDKGVGVEFNGLYWHSEAKSVGFSKDLHKEKTDLTADLGIDLIHVFSDEWRDKRPIIKSMIKHRLGCTDKRFFARNLSYCEIDLPEAKDFLNRTHIAGWTRSSSYHGLRDADGKLLLVLSVRSPRHRGRYANLAEIARFSTDLDTHVVGGLSKVLSRINLGEDVRGIMTYADLRFGRGKGYERCGFELQGNTGLDYWYTDGVLRYDRFRFRTTKEKTERQIAQEANLFRIYGCGSNVYVKNFIL